MSNPAQERTLVFEKLIPASIADVWQAWTTESGVATFFGPGSFIELHPGGAYEIYFGLDEPLGKRGGEGCRILAIEPPHMISFTWNFPPTLPELREKHQNTHLTLRLFDDHSGGTLVRLTQDGWGIGKDWQKGMAYFSRAWGEIVLPRLYQRFTSGPIRWNEL